MKIEMNRWIDQRGYEYSSTPEERKWYKKWSSELAELAWRISRVNKGERVLLSFEQPIRFLDIILESASAEEEDAIFVFEEKDLNEKVVNKVTIDYDKNDIKHIACVWVIHLSLSLKKVWWIRSIDSFVELDTETLHIKRDVKSSGRDSHGIDSRGYIE